MGREVTISNYLRLVFLGFLNLLGRHRVDSSMALSVSEKIVASIFRAYLFYLDTEDWGRNLSSAGTI